MELAVTDMPASEFLTVLSRESGINIIFSDHVVASLPNITLVGKAESIEEILRDILKDTGVTYRFSGSYIVLFASSDSSQRYTVSGIVADSISGEPIISALVYDEISGKGTLTNNYGADTIRSNSIEGRISRIFQYFQRSFTESESQASPQAHS
jgi:hypothetical protein